MIRSRIRFLFRGKLEATVLLGNHSCKSATELDYPSGASKRKCSSVSFGLISPDSINVSLLRRGGGARRY